MNAIASMTALGMMGVAASAWMLGPDGKGPGATKPGAAPAACAVVELFTSEGCSSCPPADALLAELAAQARKDGTNVLCLALHVDYWDNLGWKDLLADPAYSARQHAYAGAAGTRRVYTPQMIVNGTEELVGSDAPRVRKAIKGALAKAAKVRVAAHAGALEKGKPTTVEFELTRGPGVPVGVLDKAVVTVAIVEDGLVSKVTRGENEGKTLTHERVVRALAAASPDKQGRGRLELTVPDPVKLENAAIVVFVQEGPDRAVIGAATAEVQAPAKPADKR